MGLSFERRVSILLMKIRLFFAKCLNFILNNKMTLLFSLTLLNSIIFLIAKDTMYFFIIEALALIISLTTKRTSKVLVYNKLSHYVSMNLEDVKMFKKYNYAKDKYQISSIFKDEFIEGVMNTNAKKLKCHTHKWVLENVFQDKRITNRYFVEYKWGGLGLFTLNTLLLTNGLVYKGNNFLFPKKKVFVKLTKKY